MVALADIAAFAALVAVTVTVCGAGILDGAVYWPAEEIVPAEGLIDHVAARLLVPRIPALNCCEPEAAKLTAVGLSEIVTVWGSVITAVAV